MDFDLWSANLAAALRVLLEREERRFVARPIRRLDVGVFPWHGTIEISVLFQSDIANVKPLGDVAEWPNYNFSLSSEGGWPEASPISSEMRRAWEKDHTSAKKFFEATAMALRSPTLEHLLSGLLRSEDYLVTVFDPDEKSSVNYYLGAY